MNLRHLRMLIVNATQHRMGRATTWLAAWIAIAFGLSTVGIPCAGAGEPAKTTRPNVVVIMTDNHGAWTLGCYGNPDIRTPNIDRLAREGVQFDRAFASNPVCSPTRATFLTGLLPSQHGVHCFLVGGRLQVGPDARSTLDQFTSLPEVLKSAGYACGMVGKWHLGDNLRPQEGFDDYWITMPHGGTSTFYDAQIIEDGKLRREPQYLTDFWTDHAVKFIEQNKDGKRPFFLYLAYNGPYALGRLLLRDGRNRHAAYYADKEIASFPREAVHPWQYNNRDYANNPVSIRRVATEVSGVDDGVGRVLETLERLGLDDNTLVLFLADQGWAGGHGGYFGMGDHTRPLTATDEMMRIPMIWRHPKRIAQGRKTDLMVSNYDVMPTLLSYLDLKRSASVSGDASTGDSASATGDSANGADDSAKASGTEAKQPQSPGRDFSRALRGAAIDDWDDAVYYEFENLRCIRTPQWKYVHRHPNGPHELYDLQADPKESVNLVTANNGVAATYKATRRALKTRLDKFYAQYASPQYDMWNGGGSQTVVFRGIDETQAQLEPVSPPAVSKGFQAAKLNVPEGFTVELAAGPPLVEHPMMACFDDRGRLFVAESAGLNLRTKELEEQLPNFIRMLEDTDGDGRFDKSTIFADKLTLPQGALWHDGSLYVASPPNIWRFEDTNDDGVADRREVLVSQFGYTGNAASIHGCFLAPDGRIYWCNGRHGHEFRTEDGQVSGRGEGSYIFSCNPDGSDVRAHCGGGMDNPVEVDFTDGGEVLGTVNILYSGPRSDCLVHWLHGGTYPHSERVLGEFKRTGDLLGPVHKFGHVAVSGMNRYRSGVLQRDFRDDLFVTIFNLGKVMRLDMRRKGATFVATQHEFLSSESPDFRPTDVLEDADGSLLVVDTGGWFRIGCPASKIAKPDLMGAIYRVRRTGMPRLVDPRGLRIKWNDLAANRLASLLNDTRWVVRQKAIAECARRGDAMVDTLADSVRRRDIRQRLNAVWALTRIGTPRAQAATRLALTDQVEQIRLAACNSAATTRDKGSTAQLLKLLVEDKPPVRRVAAKALGRIGQSSAVGHLLEALDRDIDRAEEHSLIYALIEIGDPRRTSEGLASRLPAIRRGALIALEQMDAKLRPETVVTMLKSDDPDASDAALDVLTRHPEWADAAAKLVDQWLSESTLSNRQTEILRRITTTFLRHDAIAKRLGRTLADKRASNGTKQAVLGAIHDSGAIALHADWSRPLDELLRTADGDLLDETIAAVAAIKTESFDARLKAIATDVKRPVLTRVAALGAAAGRDAQLNDESFSLLVGVLKDQTAPGQTGRAARMLGESSLTAPQLEALVPLLSSAGPLELRDLIKPFARGGKRPLGEALLTAVSKSPGFFSLSPDDLSVALKRYPKELLDVANPLIVKLRARDEQKQQRLEELTPHLKQGDAERGRIVFRSEKAKCNTCHRVAADGGRIGPDLTGIGRIRNDRDLLEAIVFPSATLAREFEPYQIVTLAGKVLTGLVVRETDEAIYLQQQTGDPIVVPRDEIDVLQPSTVSVMPNGLDGAISPAELADVIRYLRTLRGQAASP